MKNSTPENVDKSADFLPGEVVLSNATECSALMGIHVILKSSEITKCLRWKEAYHLHVCRVALLFSNYLYNWQSPG